MKTKELNIQELSIQELISLDGGSQLSIAVCYWAGVAYEGICTFATEGGRNAGICVR